MKKSILSILCLSIVLTYVISCKNTNSTSSKTPIENAYFVSTDTEYARINKRGGYGAEINEENVLDYKEFLKTHDSKEAKEIKVKAKCTGVCEVKGCWMTLDNGTEDGTMVHFKDYSFFVPRDIIGKTVIIEGTIQSDTTSIKELKHYAEDAGKTKAEIEKITEPKVELTIMATGVLVNK